MKCRQLPSGSLGCRAVPWAHTGWVLLDEGHDLAGVFAAYPASFVPPDPRRDPGPGRVDHLCQRAPVALCDYPTPRAPSKAITGLYVEHQTTGTSSDSNQMEALQTDDQITPITTIKQCRAAAGRVRHRPRSLDDSGGRSPLIIKGLDLYSHPPSQHPVTHTRLGRAANTSANEKKSMRYLDSKLL